MLCLRQETLGYPALVSDLTDRCYVRVIISYFKNSSCTDEYCFYVIRLCIIGATICLKTIGASKCGACSKSTATLEHSKSESEAESVSEAAQMLVAIPPLTVMTTWRLRSPLSHQLTANHCSLLQLNLFFFLTGSK